MNRRNCTYLISKIQFLYITGNELFVPIDHYVFQAYFSPNTNFEFHIQWAESSFLKGSESASYKISIRAYAFNSHQTRIQSNHISKIFVCFDHSFFDSTAIEYYSQGTQSPSSVRNLYFPRFSTNIC